MLQKAYFTLIDQILLRESGPQCCAHESYCCAHESYCCARDSYFWYNDSHSVCNRLFLLDFKSDVLPEGLLSEEKPQKRKAAETAALVGVMHIHDVFKSLGLTATTNIDPPIY